VVEWFTIMGRLAKSKIQALLKLPLAELALRADGVRRKHLGRKFELCGIVNAKSGICGEDCKFCAQSSRHNADVPVYPLKKTEEIVKAAREAKKAGAKKFGIVTSGNRLTDRELAKITGTISFIREKICIDVCASLGALDKNALKTLKTAGLSRYHHNIETSPNFYPRIVTTHTFKERIDTVKAAKEAGLEVCSGGIIGLGETWQDRIDMAYLLRELNVDSVPLNLLVPVKGTAMEHAKPITCSDAVRAVAIFRIIMEDKTIKIAAGRESVLRDFQGLGFMAGANGMLIGGYLTVKGRSVEEDKSFVKEVENIWSQR